MTAVVEEINKLAADLVVVVGDLVDGSVDELSAAVAPLGNAKSQHGTYFVTGNHEYYSGADEWIAYLRSLGVTVLRNDRVSIGRGADTFELAGTDDYRASGFPGHGEDVDKALRDRDTSKPLVLLAHQPKTFREASKKGVDLQLSGHTHGGQIWPFGFLVKLEQGFLAGLDRIGDAQLYTSRGTGYWGPPMRLGAPAEITQVVLRAPAWAT
jgi:predicted MPP superfamily phosphohydrolase